MGWAIEPKDYAQRRPCALVGVASTTYRYASSSYASWRTSGGASAIDAFIESSSGRFRDECLNEHLFHGLRDARHIIKTLRADYNVPHPHTSLVVSRRQEFAT